MNEKTKYELRNLVIPQHIYRDNRLNWTSARVYAFIHSYTNPFFFGNEHLAEMFEVHEQTISTAMKQLEEIGLIVLTYTPKAGGGKIRLSEVAHSERAKSLIGSKKSEATNERSRSDKDIKVNNIKGRDGNKLHNIEVDEKSFKDKDWLEAKKARSEKKSSRRQYQGASYSAPSSYKEKDYKSGEKTAAHGEHII